MAKADKQNELKKYIKQVRTALEPVCPPSSASDTDLFRAFSALGLVEAEADNRLLTAASRSKDWLIRVAVCLHPNTTESQLSLLAKDPDRNVSSAANYRISQKAKD